MLSILLIELVSGHCVESLTKAYFCQKCSESRICCVKAFENRLRHVCEESVCEMVGYEAVFCGDTVKCMVLCSVEQTSLVLWTGWRKVT